MMTKKEAEALAQMDRDYIVRPIRKSHPELGYGVWSRRADHWVEFDHTQQVEGSVRYRPAGSGYAWEK